MILRVLKNPYLLASLAIHASVAAIGIYVGHGSQPASRPALLLGIEAREISGLVEADAPLPPLELAVSAVPDGPVFVIDPIPDLVPDAPAPDEALEMPPSDEGPVADSMPESFDVALLGVRNAVKMKPAASAPPPTVAAPAVASAPRPTSAPAPAPSRRGSRAETRSAERIGNAAPPYPAEALRHGWEGTAVLDVRVTSEGAVSQATVYESSGSRVLDDASIAAALTYRYSPRLVDDVPAPDWLRVPFVWRITGP